MIGDSVLFKFRYTVIPRMFHRFHAASLSLSKLLLFFVQAMFRCGGLTLVALCGNTRRRTLQAFANVKIRKKSWCSKIQSCYGEVSLFPIVAS